MKDKELFACNHRSIRYFMVLIPILFLSTLLILDDVETHFIAISLHVRIQKFAFRNLYACMHI